MGFFGDALGFVKDAAGTVYGGTYGTLANVGSRIIGGGDASTFGVGGPTQLGLVDDNVNAAARQAALQRLGTSTAPQVVQGAQIQPAAGGVRQQQVSQLERLAGVAGGQQIGAGQLAAQRGLEQAQAQQFALAGSARGANAALARRAAAQQAAQIGQAGASQLAQAGLQDRAAAEAALGQAAAGIRGQDIGLATNQAQLNQQAALANQQAALQARQLDDAQRAQLINIIAGQQRAQGQLTEQAQGRRAGLVGGLLDTAGSLITQASMASDKRVKQGIRKQRGEDVDDLLRKLAGKEYEYKPEMGLRGGRHTGILAQDLEKSKIGRGIVVEHQGVKSVDIGRATGATLASLARLNERLDRLEHGNANRR